MNYRLSFQNATYPVADIHIPAESILAQAPGGQPFSFVSPVQLTIGQDCELLGDAGDYQLHVNACFGFTYLPQFLVSGVIAPPQVAPASAVAGTARKPRP